MNSIINEVWADFAHFYIGLLVFLAAWGILDTTFDVFGNLVNSAYQKIQAFKKRKENKHTSAQAAGKE